MNPNEFIPTRRSPLSRLKDWDNQDSWREFFNTYWRLIYDFARKAGLKDAEAQDVVQETVISVANQMKGFKYDPKCGSFKAWLMQITRRRIADHLRKRYRSGAVDALNLEDPAVAAMLSELPEASASVLDAMWEEEWRRHMAEALGVSTVQVYMARHRVGKMVKKEIQHLDQKMI